MGETLNSVTGIVVPVDWDDKGMPTAVALLSPGGSDYYVQADENGKALLELVTKEVEVRGEVKKGRHGRNMIAVRGYDLRTGEEPCIIE